MSVAGWLEAGLAGWLEAELLLAKTILLVSMVEMTTVIMIKNLFNLFLFMVDCDLEYVKLDECLLIYN